MFRSWSADVYRYCLDIILRLVFVSFLQNELFSTEVNRYYIGILCMQLLLQFYAVPFETLQVFRSWSEDVHII